MEPRTDTANTQSWQEGKRIKLRPYIESCVSTLNMGEKPISGRNFYEALSKVSIRYKKSTSIPIEARLRQEFQSWDSLSDEALTNFEQKLD